MSAIKIMAGLVLAGVIGGYVGFEYQKIAGKSQGGIQPQSVADALHAVLAADRGVYAETIVNRLANQEKIIKATEHWKDEKTLPLPAQMLRMGSEKIAEQNLPFSYALLSLWPINKKNSPKTEVEKTGLQYVIDHPGENYYANETLGDKNYFTAVYTDNAVSAACVTCHNTHPDSPRTDFKDNDVMGGIVIRIPVKN
jgi:hypothetical protein